MDFIEYALKMEDKTKHYYLELADKCIQNEGIKNILNMLASEHEKHYDTLKLMEQDKCNSMEKTESFKEVDEIFNQMKQNKETFHCDIDQLTLYEKALNLVEKKYNFYSETLKNIDCPENKKIIEQIRAEEKHQKYVLENIIEMVNRPLVWIENAEFYHFEEY
jgi:hypothetical protein